MKITSAAILSLVLPLALAAQQPQGDPANPLTTVFRRNITNAERNIAQAFDSIPESKFSYKPTPAQLTIGFIAQHVAADNYFFCNNFGAMKANLTAEDTATKEDEKAKWPKAKLVSKLKDSFAFCQNALGQLNDAALSENITLTFGNQSQQRPRVSMVLGHAIDLTDHYSQLANYMRLNGLIPPTALPRSQRGGN